MTFLFNLSQVLSTSHLICSLLWDRFIKFLKGIQFKDEYPFDLGYWLSLSSTICLMSLVFSVTMPILTGVGFCFCASRYFIEKYNVLFVYQKDFDSQGTMLVPMFTYQILGILTYQILNFSFILSLGLDTQYTRYAYAFGFFQIWALVTLYYINKKWPSFLKPESFQSRQAEEFLEMKLLDHNTKRCQQNENLVLQKRIKSIHERVGEEELNDITNPDPDVLGPAAPRSGSDSASNKMVLLSPDVPEPDSVQESPDEISAADVVEMWEPRTQNNF